MSSRAFELAGTKVDPGTRRIVDIPLSMMSDHTPATLSVQVIHGRREGPAMFVSAAVHGDEIVGVEIVRRLANAPALRSIAGTVLLVPIVNSFGFISQSRYLPDRRDLNRSFPGSPSGSLASRLANLFLNEVVSRCQFGIDLHSAAMHRSNLPQIRIDLHAGRLLKLAQVFGAPVILGSSLREGSLRRAASERGVPVMVYEGGEALRFDEYAIRAGLKGALRVMRHLGIVQKAHIDFARTRTVVAQRSIWQRATEGGLLRTRCTLGAFVEQGELLGVISDPFGNSDVEVLATNEGLVIGCANMPVVNQGDALFHIAAVPRSALSESALQEIGESVENNLVSDEDELL